MGGLLNLVCLPFGELYLTRLPSVSLLQGGSGGRKLEGRGGISWRCASIHLLTD